MSKKKEEVIDTKEEAIEAKSVDNEAEVLEETEKADEKHIIKAKPVELKGRFPIGSIVFISKDADADLNGFKLFPQYKKYTYTVEAYDGHTGVYTLRRLNLSLKLKESEILAPNERHDSAVIRKQY